ncbi:MAG TPA: TRAP transporter small permease [Casimicrobiaceae bacterium]|nr:TRAP transporter small permease [Casimicrobiaceae bacterium]
MTRRGGARPARATRPPEPPNRPSAAEHPRGARPKHTGLDVYVAVVNFLSRVAGVFAAGLIGLAVLVVCDMVIERFILNHTTIWQIDVVTYSIVAATFVGSGYVLMLRGHVNVDVLPLHLGPRARYWLALMTTVLALGFCVVLLVLCTQFWYQAYSGSWRSNTVWRARLWVPYLAMPVGLGLLVLQYAAELLCLATGRAPPFGIKKGLGADELALAQARQALAEAP